jgi:hypothetical protein
MMVNYQALSPDALLQGFPIYMLTSAFVRLGV